MQAIREQIAGTIPHWSGNFREWLIVFEACASSSQALRAVLAGLPTDLPASIVVVQHRPPGHTPDLCIVYRDGGRIEFVRSAENPLSESAGRVFADRVIGVVLSGSGREATAGAQQVKAHGGVVIAQDEQTSEDWGMPRAAIAARAVDFVLPLDAIAPMLARLVEDPRLDGIASPSGLA